MWAIMSQKEGYLCTMCNAGCWANLAESMLLCKVVPASCMGLAESCFGFPLHKLRSWVA